MSFFEAEISEVFVFLSSTTLDADNTLIFNFLFFASFSN
jgi:hypothetical protein